MLEITTLGDLAIRVDGKPVTGFASRKAEALLAYLAVTRQPQPREHLADLLWDEQEQERALGNLRVVLSSMRKELKLYMDIQRDRVGFARDAPLHVDVHELAEAAPSPTSPGAMDALIKTLESCPGEFLLGFHIRNAPVFENWVTIEREHFRSVCDNKFQALLDCLICACRWQEVLEWGEKWILRSRGGHISEAAYRAMMKAHAGLGDLPGLSAVYQRCIQYLREELGVDPSEQTQQLYIQLLGGKAPAQAPQAAADVQTTPSASAAQVVLNRWHAVHGGFIDIAGMALVYSSLNELQVSEEDVNLIIRSVLHHSLDVRPWLQRIPLPATAVETLKQSLSDAPQYVRLQIIDALKGIPGDHAQQALIDLALQERSPEVRVEAALAVAERGGAEALSLQLAKDITEGDTSAIGPLVALVDKTGEFPPLDRTARLMVWMGLLKRRYARNRDAVRSMVLRSTVAAVIVSLLHGATAPLHAALFYPADYVKELQQVTLFGWVLSGAVGYLFIGGVQGLATGYAVGITDALGALQHRRKWRILAGGISGLLYAFVAGLFTAADYTDWTAGALVTLPALILWGLVFGAGLSFMYPELGVLRSHRQQLMRFLWVCAGLLPVTALQTYVLYSTETLEVLPARLAFVLLFTFGLALAFGRKGGK